MYKLKTITIKIKYLTERDLWHVLRGIFLKKIALATRGKGPESKFTEHDQLRYVVNSEVEE